MRVLKQIILFSMIWITFIGCRSETIQYDPIDAPPIDVEFVLEIKNGNDYYFGMISDVVVASDGSILVADPKLQRVHIFDSEGQFINSALSIGRGPGEVQRIYWYLGFTGQDELLVYDLPQRRISIYDFIDGELLVRNNVNLKLSPNSFHLTNDGNLVLHIQETGNSEDEDSSRLVIMNLDGVTTNENFLEFENNVMMDVTNLQAELLLRTSSPHHANNIVRFHDDKLIFNRTNDLGFIVYDLNSGEIIHQTSLMRPDYPLSSTERQEFADDLIERAMLEQVRVADLISQMPETKGKVKDLHYDPEGYVWLNIIDDNGPEWLIFSDTGDLLGSRYENFDGKVIRIQNGRVFVITDDEDDAPMLKVYQYRLN